VHLSTANRTPALPYVAVSRPRHLHDLILVLQGTQADNVTDLKRLFAPAASVVAEYARLNALPSPPHRNLAWATSPLPTPAVLTTDDTSRAIISRLKK
jgi:hypothetical protein